MAEAWEAIVAAEYASRLMVRLAQRMAEGEEHLDLAYDVTMGALFRLLTAYDLMAFQSPHTSWRYRLDPRRALSSRCADLDLIHDWSIGIVFDGPNDDSRRPLAGE